MLRLDTRQKLYMWLPKRETFVFCSLFYAQFRFIHIEKSFKNRAYWKKIIKIAWASHLHMVHCNYVIFTLFHEIKALNRSSVINVTILKFH